MNLLTTYKIFEEIDRVCDVVNSTIGILQMEKEIVNEDIIQIVISDYTQNEVSKFLRTKIYLSLIADRDDSFVIGVKTYQDCDEILISYKVDENAKETNHKVLKILVDTLYFAVDEAKVEFNQIVELYDDEVSEDNVPMEVIDQLENWNDECDSYDSDPTYIEDLTIYSLPKNALYSISLGYFDINEELFESDFIPELMGYVLDIVDDFFSITSYEDDNIYFYISGELNAEQIDALEDAIMETLPMASKKEQNETLEDLYQDYVEEEK